MRTTFAVLFGLLAAGAIALGLVAFDARAELLDTDRWVDDTRPVVEEPAVRRELSGMLVEGVAAQLACRGGAVATTLLALGVGDRARAALQGRVEEALDSPRVRAAWVDANRTAHGTFVRSVRLDREPGADRLLDVATLLDVVGGVVAGSDDAAAQPSDGGDGCGSSSTRVQLLDQATLTQAADSARLLHRWRRGPELLLLLGAGLLLISFLFARAAASFAGFGVGAALVGLGAWTQREALLDSIRDRIGEGQGGVTARAIADAASESAFTHQLAFGIAGCVALVIAAILALSRSSRRR